MHYIFFLRSQFHGQGVGDGQRRRQLAYEPTLPDEVFDKRNRPGVHRLTPAAESTSLFNFCLLHWLTTRSGASFGALGEPSLPSSGAAWPSFTSGFGARPRRYGPTI